ncbi:hypothetical protein GCM10010293_36750 [Streptomyces griseoflavus]|nr:hypothetical protein [Streptomyces griseoflavus]GGV34325.1 hypothetical protein GCM10010293_36750 [Streptomyces griseoflavus]
MIAPLFPVLTVLAFAGLCALALRDVPRITGTVAFVLTLAALGVATLR